MYPTKVIGTQIWSQKNLSTIYYRNGDPIPYIEDPKEWANLTIGACCRNPNYGFNKEYGYLFNWYVVNDPRGLAPEGCHIPSENEWNTLLII